MKHGTSIYVWIKIEDTFKLFNTGTIPMVNEGKWLQSEHNYNLLTPHNDFYYVRLGINLYIMQ